MIYRSLGLIDVNGGIPFANLPSIFCVEWAWEKQINTRLGLRAACKFDYADYDDRLYYPDTAVDLKYFLLKYNRMVSLSTGINIKF
jgi:hypothetical protein